MFELKKSQRCRSTCTVFALNENVCARTGLVWQMLNAHAEIEKKATAKYPIKKLDIISYLRSARISGTVLSARWLWLCVDIHSRAFALHKHKSSAQHVSTSCVQCIAAYSTLHHSHTPIRIESEFLMLCAGGGHRGRIPNTGAGRVRTRPI